MARLVAYRQDSLDAEITVLLGDPLAQDPGGCSPVQQVSRLEECIRQAQTVPYVPDPIRLRGVGGTTL